MNLRTAVESDLAAITRIYNAAIPERLATADTEVVSVESRRDWFYAHTIDRHPIWVSEQDGVVAGWLSLQPFYGRPAYRKTVEVSIYVDPSWQGQGIGKKLMRHSIESCPELEITTLLGFIFGHNQPSLNLFHRFGFEPWGHLPQIAELDRVERDLVILGRRIKPQLNQ